MTAGTILNSMKNRTPKQAILILICWLARIATALVFLFWGAFFVEHLMEWFVKPFPNVPPLKVFLAQFLHFLMLAGLLVTLRWPQVGSPVAILAAAIFLARTGANYPAFLTATILPVLVLTASWWALRRITTATPVSS